MAREAHSHRAGKGGRGQPVTESEEKRNALPRVRMLILAGLEFGVPPLLVKDVTAGP